MRFTIIIRLLSFLFFLSGCASVPITGRKQLNLISNSSIIPMSFESYKKVLQESILSDDAEETEMIKTVGRRVELWLWAMKLPMHLPIIAVKE
jgi:hypothetical protein